MPEHTRAPKVAVKIACAVRDGSKSANRENNKMSMKKLLREAMAKRSGAA